MEKEKTGLENISEEELINQFMDKNLTERERFKLEINRRLINEIKEFNEKSSKQSERTEKISEDNLILSKKFFILAIITLIVTCIIPLYQNYQEKTKQINDLISKIDSLSLELETNGIFIEQISERLNWGLTFNEPILENLQNAVSNGNIRNETLKREIISLYFELLEIRNSIKILNSPEYPQIFSTSETYLKKSSDFAKNIESEIKGRDISGKITNLKNHILNYKICLTEKENFDTC